MKTPVENTNPADPFCLPRLLSLHDTTPSVSAGAGLDGGPAGPRLRVGVVIRHFGARFGGAERYAVSLVEHLAKRHEFHVFAQTVEHAHPDVTYHLQPHPRERPRWLTLLRFGQWAQRESAPFGFDVIHSHENLWFGDVHTFHVRTVREGLWGRHRGGLRHGWARLQAGLSPRLLAYLWLEKARILGGGSARIRVAASALLAKEIMRHYPDLTRLHANDSNRPDSLPLPQGERGLKPKPNTLFTATGDQAFQGAHPTPVQVIAPGVDRPLRVGQHAARQHLGLPLEAHGLLFVGNDYARKGLATALEALSRIYDPKTVLWVVGDTAQKPRFEALAHRHGLGARVRFVGPQKQMSMWYEAADTLIHPTTEDSFGMVVLEAMACGCPVVVSPSPWCGLCESLTDPLHAWQLNTPWDVEGLAQAIEVLQTDPSQRKARAHAGRQFADTHGWERQAAAYEAVYAQAKQARHTLERARDLGCS